MSATRNEKWGKDMRKKKASIYEMLDRIIESHTATPRNNKEFENYALREQKGGLKKCFRKTTKNM